jgi:NAD/NADP transhydrogenase beta subunit
MAAVTKNINFFKLPKLLYFLFSIFSLAAILVGSPDHRTQLWKGAIQESFQQSLVEIGSVVSEKIFLNIFRVFW